MAFLHGIAEIKAEMLFLTGAEEIMEDTQPILVVQRLCAALQPSEVFAEIGVYPVKKGASSMFFRATETVMYLS